jgi:glycosyltransferase involved in cell wall biosynthesis
MLSPYTWSRSTWTKRLYWRAVEARNLASVRCFHVTSKAEAQEVADLGATTAPSVVISQGLDADAWQTETRPGTLRRRCGEAAGDRPIVLFLSRLHPKKGIVDFLLPAFARQKTDAFLAIAGGPDEHAPAHETEVRAAVERLGLSDRVALLGSIPAEERWALFDGAALFVLPSRSENFGIVVTEAMARGLPVVVSQEVQAAEHVRAAGAGRVVPLEVGALAATLDELLGNPEATRALGAHGRQYVREHLSWDRIAGSIVEMYRMCLARTIKEIA